VTDICYLYGIVPAGTGLRRVPAGIDERPVELIDGDAGENSALATRVDATEYSPARVESLAGNIDWVRDRAEAHDRVLNWASDIARVIPLPMWTMFRDVAAVRGMLAERREEFEAVFARVADAREYTVRAYVRTADLQAHLSEHSEEFRSLEAQAKSASPGQRYLLERKLDEKRKESARQVLRGVATEVHEALAAAALDAVRDEIVASVTASEQGHAILNASYLVKSDKLPEFRRALTKFMNRYQPSGFTFEFTGPWPPYHFVGGRAGR
jgi:hypothetical protein